MKSLFLILMFSGAAFCGASGLSMTGVDDFKQLARSGKIVDKTLLIKDLIERNDLVTLITRPRRFGKSTNLSMLWRFFALEHDPIEAKENRDLFETRKIRNEARIFENYQGKCPSIFLSFKDVNGETLEELTRKLKAAVSLEFRRHVYLTTNLERNNPLGASSDLKKFRSLLLNDGREASKADLERSLQFLSQLLSEYHSGKPVCVFIDEYDAPLHKAFKNGHLTDGTELIQNLFLALLKNNPVLDRAIITGIFHLSEADLFSGINNIVEDSVIRGPYASHYGFTETDLDDLFWGSMQESKDRFKKMYRGYKFYNGLKGTPLIDIYNPWSAIGFLKNNGVYENYWISTGETELLDDLILLQGVQNSLNLLLSRRTIHLKIPKDITLIGSRGRPEALWPLLFHTGYLTFADVPVFNEHSNEYEVDLVVPNIEILSAYSQFYRQFRQNNKYSR